MRPQTKNSILIVLLVAAFTVGVSQVRAETSYPDHWRVCATNADCVKVYGCQDEAVNSQYVQAFKGAFLGCDARQISDPKMAAKCVNNRCTLDLADQWK